MECQKVEEEHPYHSKGACLFICWECKKKIIDIRCFKCQKIVPEAYFKSPERKALYQAGDIIYTCIGCVIDTAGINQDDYDAEELKKVKGIWGAFGKDAQQAEINGKKFESVIKKEKETGKY